MFVMVRVSVLMLSGTPARYSSSTACSAKFSRDAGLQIAGGANLQMNVFAIQMFDQRRIFDTSHAVADSRRAETRAAFPKRCPGPEPRRHERCDAGRDRSRNETPECAHQSDIRLRRPRYRAPPRGCLEIAPPDLAVSKALFAIEMAQRAQNQPGFDATGSNAGFGGAIHGGHHLLRRQSTLEVQQRREANLGVNHAIGGELLEQILHHQRQRRFVLHQLEAARRTRQKIRQTGAARRSDELALVLFERNGIIQLRHRGVAQRAIQMQMQFDFREVLSHSRVSATIRCRTPAARCRCCREMTP